MYIVREINVLLCIYVCALIIYFGFKVSYEGFITVIVFSPPRMWIFRGFQLAQNVTARNFFCFCFVFYPLWPSLTFCWYELELFQSYNAQNGVATSYLCCIIQINTDLYSALTWGRASGYGQSKLNTSPYLMNMD